MSIFGIIRNRTANIVYYNFMAERVTHYMAI